MSEEEVELVAELLAKIGGTWNPERAQPASRIVGNRHRDVARLVLDAVERSKAANRNSTGTDPVSGEPSEADAITDAKGNRLYVGANVVYQPPGDKRTLTCRVEKMEQGRAYVVPSQREIGWVSTHTLLPLKPIREVVTPARQPSPAAAEADTVAPQAAAPVSEPIWFNPAQPMKVGDASARVQHYFSSMGEWIAFRRYPGDRYLFDHKGNWIGWFPWGDNDIVDLNGQYLGTVMDGNRIYRKMSPDPGRREAGFIVHPGRSGYAGYPGYTAHCLPPFGFKDLDMSKIPMGRRFWLKSHGRNDASRNPSLLYALLSKIGLGALADWIEGMIRPGRKS